MSIEPDRHWFRSFLYIIILFILLLLWAALSESCRRTVPLPGSGISDLSGSGGGNGSGSSDSGSGPGAGTTGNGDSSGSDNTEKSSSVNPNGESANSVQGAQASSVKPKSSSNNGSNEKIVAIESLEKPQPPPAATGNQQLGNVNSHAAGRKGFYGLEAKPSGKVLFLIDTSGSMGAPSSDFTGLSRLEVLKKELAKYIFDGNIPSEKTYKRSGGFILVAFSSNTQLFDNGNFTRYSNRADMKQTQEYISKLVPLGGTMMRDAWQKSLKLVKSKDIDTIYFLTDGEPGDGFSSDWALDRMKSVSSNVVVHCITLGGKRDFMEEIAKKRKGKYIVIP